MLGEKWKTTAPVAVGSSGIATSRDGIEFEIGEQTVIITNGGAFVKVPLTTELHLEGPGVIELTGQFRLSSPQEVATDVRSVRMESAPFAIDIIPVPGGIQIKGDLRGRLFINDTGSTKSSK